MTKLSYFKSIPKELFLSSTVRGPFFEETPEYIAHLRKLGHLFKKLYPESIIKSYSEISYPSNTLYTIRLVYTPSSARNMFFDGCIALVARRLGAGIFVLQDNTFRDFVYLSFMTEKDKLDKAIQLIKFLGFEKAFLISQNNAEGDENECSNRKNILEMQADLEKA